MPELNRMNRMRGLADTVIQQTTNSEIDVPQQTAF